MSYFLFTEADVSPVAVIILLLASLNSCSNPWIYLAFSGSLLNQMRVCIQPRHLFFIKCNIANHAFLPSNKFPLPPHRHTVCSELMCQTRNCQKESVKRVSSMFEIPLFLFLATHCMQLFFPEKVCVSKMNRKHCIVHTMVHTLTKFCSITQIPNTTT